MYTSWYWRSCLTQSILSRRRYNILIHGFSPYYQVPASYTLKLGLLQILQQMRNQQSSAIGLTRTYYSSIHDAVGYWIMDLQAAYSPSSGPIGSRLWTPTTSLLPTYTHTWPRAWDDQCNVGNPPPKTTPNEKAGNTYNAMLHQTTRWARKLLMKVRGRWKSDQSMCRDSSLIREL